jgi:hypothetical protein
MRAHIIQIVAGVEEMGIVPLLVSDIKNFGILLRLSGR